MSKVTKGYYSGYVASAYWSTNKLPKPTHYRGYVTLEDADIDELKQFGSVLITWFSTDKLGDVYPCYQQDFTQIGFDLSKDKPIEKHPYGNTLALVFEEDNAPPVQHDNAPLYNEQLAEKELAGDLPLDDSSETKIITAPPVQQKEKPSLLNIPAKRDEWFEVINDMANQFHAENGAIPTAAQALNLLCTQREITTDKDKGEFFLIMEGCKPLGKKAFRERWRKYTK